MTPGVVSAKTHQETTPGVFLAIPAAVVLVHVLFLTTYGWFRDEFYYLACARHLAFGYVDHPALSILPLWFVRLLFGDSLIAIRLIAALASGATVAIVGATARQMGGGRTAQALAMLAAAIAPEYLALGSFYSMNVFDVTIWALAGWLVVTLLKAPRISAWIALGVLIGLGTENKISVLWLGGGIGLGFLVSRFRVVLTAGPWIAALIAAVLFAPYVMWQAQHGWPTIEFIKGASGDKMVAQSPLSFITAQVMNMHPPTLPIWLAGLWFFLVDRRGRLYRPLGVTYLAVLVLLIVNSTSRAGYLSPAYTMLFAGGACWLEPALVVSRRLARVTIMSVLVAAGLVTAPIAMPLLPVDTYVRYAAALDQAPTTEEKKELADLPQFFADRFGWHELVSAVSTAYATLTPDERRVAAIITSNYGEAGAIDVLGRQAGLPFATSGHNNYWFWGQGPTSGDVLIALTPSRTRLDTRFDDVRQVATIDCDHCMPYENHRPVFVCRLPKQRLSELWPLLKHFD